MVQNNDMPLVFTMNLASTIEAFSRNAERAMEKQSKESISEDGRNLYSVDNLIKAR